MEQTWRIWLFALVLLIIASDTSFAQSRIQLVQGRRAIRERVTFVLEVERERRPNPRYEAAPEDMHLFIRFADRPATGMVYLDDKPLGRFDESMSFASGLINVGYGRHSVTLTFVNPTILIGVTLDVRGGVAREILEAELSPSFRPAGLENRIVALEQRIQELEAEIVALKKKRP